MQFPAVNRHSNPPRVASVAKQKFLHGYPDAITCHRSASRSKDRPIASHRACDGDARSRTRSRVRKLDGVTNVWRKRTRGVFVDKIYNAMKDNSVFFSSSRNRESPCQLLSQLVSSLSNAYIPRWYNLVNLSKTEPNSESLLRKYCNICERRFDRHIFDL